MKIKLIAIALVATSYASFAALPVPSVLPKNGDCPASYVAKANECQPTKEAKFAVAKSGTCPENYEAEGNYCVATQDARLAIRRAAMSCPKGFTSIGDYCVSDN